MKKILLAIISLLMFTQVLADTKTIDLTVSYKTVNYAGKNVKAIAVNNSIPAPTLHFKEGDHVIINVYNHLKEDTAIHWHGLIVPWQMDGVEGLSQRGIPPGGVFHYEFTLHQSGTYWYHAHAGLQEQQGLYGAFIIDPINKPTYYYTKDYPILLSDWSNTDPQKILANLKKSGDYYSPRFPLQPSLTKFLQDYFKANKDERESLITDYLDMEKSRMGLYDLSDVAYDTFLLNGQTSTQPWTALVKKGDSVRLRFIGASGSTIFHVKIPGTVLHVIHVEGNDVKPYDTDYLTIAPGETYDVIVNITQNNPYIIYAESIDTKDAAIGALITSPQQVVNVNSIAPFPEPKPVSRSMMMTMMAPTFEGSLPADNKMEGMNHDAMSHSMMSMPMTMNDSHSMSMPMTMDDSHTMHMSMQMPTEPANKGDSIAPPNNHYKTSTGTSYDKVVSLNKTNDPNKPVDGVINMELFGYMDRYLWFVNGVPEDKAPPIILQPNKRYRFVFTNNSMMFHPMHLHGHWFILRKGEGAYDPLLHTIDVPPGATITADVDTDASGQWFFHCHLLYHMMSGMARSFQYSTLLELSQGKIAPENQSQSTDYYNRPIVREDELFPLDKALVAHPMPHGKQNWYSTLLDIGVNPFTEYGQLSLKGLYGSDDNKLEVQVKEAEIEEGTVENADVDLFYYRPISQFWAVKGGANYFYRPAEDPYWQPGIGLEGLMPYFIETDIRTYYHSGSSKWDLDFTRDTQLTNNFFLGAEIRSILATKTVTDDQVGNGLNEMRYSIKPYYRMSPGTTIYIEYEYDKDYGEFKNLQLAQGDSATESTFSVGFTWLF